MLHIACACAMYRETQLLRRHQRSGMQDHAQLRVAQQHLEIIRGHRTVALQGDVGEHRLGHAEQLQCLVDQVRAQVVPQPGAGLVAFAPAVGHGRPVTVEVRVEFHDFAQRALRDQLAQGEEVGIPAPVLEYADDTAGAFRTGDHLLRLAQGHGERLVDHDMLALRQRRAGQYGMHRIGRGDDDQVDARIGKCGFGFGDYLHAGMVDQYLARIARDHGVQAQAGGVRDQRRMEHLADEAVADQRHIEEGLHCLTPVAEVIPFGFYISSIEARLALPRHPRPRLPHSRAGSSRGRRFVHAQSNARARQCAPCSRAAGRRIRRTPCGGTGMMWSRYCSGVGC